MMLLVLQMGLLKGLLVVEDNNGDAHGDANRVTNGATDS